MVRSSPPLSRRCPAQLDLGNLAAHHTVGLLIAEVNLDAPDIILALGNLDLFEEIDALDRRFQFAPQQDQLLFNNPALGERMQQLDDLLDAAGYNDFIMQEEETD